jgi:hypothetical protein
VAESVKQSKREEMSVSAVSRPREDSMMQKTQRAEGEERQVANTSQSPRHIRALY